MKGRASAFRELFVHLILRYLQFSIFLGLFSLFVVAGSLKLEWDSSQEPGVAGYNLYRSSFSGGGYTRLNSQLISSTSYTDSAVENNRTYYYVVTAVSTTGIESGFSNEVLAKLESSTTLAGSREAELVFAQFANGIGFVSTFVLTNPSGSEAASGSLSFLDDLGQPLSLSLNGHPPASVVAFRIEPLGTARFTTNGLGRLFAGSARVDGNIPISGIVEFSYAGLGTTGIGQSTPLAALMLPVTRDAVRGLNTGFALTNIQPSDVDVAFSLLGLDGIQVAGGFASARLPGNGHLGKMVSELFPEARTSDLQGTLLVSALTPGGKMAATAIQVGSKPGEFANLPVMAIEPAFARRELTFPHFGNGSGLVSSLVLLNPDTSEPNAGQVTCYDSGGNETGLFLDGQTVTERASFNLRPRGGAVLTTTGQGTLLQGSARVSAGKAVGGLLQISVRGIGTAGVEASEPTSNFIIPVTRSEARGVSTGIAVTSMRSPVTLTLTLRNREGRPVGGGQATLRLPANGHFARLVEGLFPNVEMDEFEGTLTAIAEGGQIAGIAVQLGLWSHQLVALPLAPLR